MKDLGFRIADMRYGMWHRAWGIAQGVKGDVRSGETGETFHCHLPPASFGHYAVLSFVVRGKSPNSECSFQLLCFSSLTPET
jgi:hypothetical protein